MSGIELKPFNYIDLLLMVESGIRNGICHSVLCHAKANNKYMMNYIKNKESSYIIYLDEDNFYGFAISKKLPAGGFEWRKA